MQIARPANGFRIIENPGVSETLKSASDACPWLLLAYANIKERLRMAGHKTGYMIKDNPTRRYFVEADPVSQKTRLVVAYNVLGDTLTVYAIKVLI